MSFGTGEGAGIGFGFGVGFGSVSTGASSFVSISLEFIWFEIDSFGEDIIFGLNYIVYIF
jgi:hypothetical protein